MGWRFRRSFKVIPGVRLNLSKSGLSASFGGAPVTLNIGTRGVYGTASLPGTGISFRQRLAGSEDGDNDSLLPMHFITPEPLPGHAPLPAPARLPAPASTSAVTTLPIEEVRSGSTELMTSESLRELKRLIETTHKEYSDISFDLDVARLEKRTAYDRHFAWEGGFFLKRIFKKKFAERTAALETAEAKVAELELSLIHI